jgi:DNA polymerase III epsilon subunit-like protein
MNRRHVMIDLETLGTRPGDTILSIGAVKFDVDKEITEKFYVTIDSESCKAAGLRAQKSTLEWWGKQSEAARTAAFKGEFSLDAALTKLTMWMPPLDDAVVWGNGANFDFWNDRCYRTVFALFAKAKKKNVGVEHNALDDAVTQALTLIELAKTHGFELK